MPRSRAAIRSTFVGAGSRERHQLQFAAPNNRTRVSSSLLSNTTSAARMRSAVCASLPSYKIKLPDASRSAARSRSPFETVS